MSIQSTRPFLHDLAARRNRVEGFLVAAHELPGMPLDERIDVTEDVIAFLAETLLPHSEATEMVLCAEAERVLERGGVRGAIAFDREEIRGRIRELADTDPRRTGRLQELLYALHLLCAGSLQKEEELYLLMLDDEPGTMERVMDDMAELEYSRVHPEVSLQRL